MTEIFVSPLVSLLIEKLTPVALSFIPSDRIDRKLKEWTNMLVTIEAVLEDAEDRQIVERHIKLWLHDVQKLAFEIEDLVDDLRIETRRRQMIATPESSSSGRLRKFASRFNATAIRFNYDMDHKIAAISNSLQELEKRMNIFSLQKWVGGKTKRTGDLRHPLTSSLVDPAHVRGREEDSAAILTWLVEESRMSNHGGKVRIISIVGMGGIGKTTLAQSLYSNAEEEDCFDDRLWVCVTDDFDVFRISKTIYENVYDKGCEFSDLNKVQEKLREKLSKSKFLLVLDDVWNQDYAKWDLLCAPFHGGEPKSTIIVTTRSQDVAKIMGSNKVYDLKELSDGDCLSLLAQHAFEKQNFDGHPEFTEVGEVIAKRCKGLPLAAKSLGGLLRTKGSLNQWIEVSTSKIWELQSNGIMPALRLSYHHLPPYLKPLFAYCSIFPKSHEFDQHELIMLWMAQGFLGESEGKKEMEELGCEYFSELLARSFFQPSTRNGSRFVMHDLNNDLAQFVSGLLCFRLENEMKSNEQYKVSNEARHASFISHRDDDFKGIKAFNAARYLRTILVTREKYSRLSYSSNLVIKDFPKFPRLRALSFSGYYINELPKSVVNLNHLRYLDLSRTNIKELPKSICDFSNLQTLLLYGCHNLVQLPTKIQKLINLRHLVIVDTPSLKEMPLGIGLLTHLRTLSKFIVGKSKGLKVFELKNLHLLRGTISIIGLENVISVQDAMEANLSGKEGLHGLEMKWSDNSSDTGLEFDVLDALKPQKGLASLVIEFYGGLKFPRWLGDRSLGAMVKVRLVNCKNCANLPPLGQLTSLKELVIQGMHGVKIVGQEFFGTGSRNFVSFQSLIKLRFKDMGSWEEWFDDSTSGAFPCLQDLQMLRCMKLNKVSLQRIPSTIGLLKIRVCGETVLRSIVGISSVKKLEVYDISGLSKLDEGIVWCLEEVEDLSVSKCKQLRYLWEEEVACQVLEKLKSLSVSNCEQLESLGDEEQLLPRNLEILDLSNCNKIEKMPNWQNNFTSLRQLRIINCMKLQDKLASTKDLQPKTDNCGKHEFLNLESVIISQCPSLKGFPMGKNLYVRDCENLVEIEEGENSTSLSLVGSVSFDSLSNLKSFPQGLAHLTRLDINGCSGIESIPKTSLPPTLITLQIQNCKKLKYILCANEMQSLTSLRQLKIMFCNNLEGYPSGGLWPPNLESLYISDVKQSIKDWGLATLPTSLRKLSLNGEFPQLVSFSELGSQLVTATSLTCLQIFSLKNLKCFGNGLDNLSSLQQLELWGCPKLQELPKTLLPALSSLCIDYCPVLEEMCKKDQKTDYWPKISHIPHLSIDGESMGNPYLQSW